MACPSVDNAKVEYQGRLVIAASSSGQQLLMRGDWKVEDITRWTHDKANEFLMQNMSGAKKTFFLGHCAGGFVYPEGTLKLAIPFQTPSGLGCSAQTSGW